MKLFLALLITMLPAVASERIAQIKDYLGQREQVARIYMPQQAIQGEPMQVLIVAPGASSVTVSGSRASDAEPLRLVSAPLDASGRVNLSLDIPVKPVPVVEEASVKSNKELTAAEKSEQKKSKKEKQMKSKPEPDVYYIEAVLDYPSGEQRKAMVFGSSASYVGFNGVQVLKPIKDAGGSAASMARSFIPGMAGMPVGNY